MGNIREKANKETNNINNTRNDSWQLQLHRTLCVKFQLHIKANEAGRNYY